MNEGRPGGRSLAFVGLRNVGALKYSLVHDRLRRHGHRWMPRRPWAGKLPKPVSVRTEEPFSRHSVSRRLSRPEKEFEVV